MSRRVYFSDWGRGPYSVPAYAIRRELEDDEDAVARSIADHSGLQVIRVRGDGETCGCPQFYATLGDPAYGGGWTPRAEVWFVIEDSSRA